MATSAAQQELIVCDGSVVSRLCVSRLCVSRLLSGLKMGKQRKYLVLAPLAASTASGTQLQQPQPTPECIAGLGGSGDGILRILSTFQCIDGRGQAWPGINKK